MSRGRRHPEACARSILVFSRHILHFLPVHTTMEDGEIPEDAPGGSYRPEFEWQGGDEGLSTGWVEASMVAGPSSTTYAPPIPVQSSQAQVGDTIYCAISLTASSPTLFI